MKQAESSKGWLPLQLQLQLGHPQPSELRSKLFPGAFAAIWGNTSTDFG